MTLRIFEEADEHGAKIELHGWLSAAEVGELETLAARQHGPLRIELSQVAGVDIEGLRTLRRLRAGGARLTGATPYVELLLQRSEAGEEGT